MSATDEELEFVRANKMDHVTYILMFFRSVHVSFCPNKLLIHPAFSLAFLLYAFIVFLINLYATTGRNAASNTAGTVFSENIEMTTPGGRLKWYSRVPSSRRTRGLGPSAIPTHVLGDEDDDEEITPRMEMMNVGAGRRV